MQALYLSHYEEQKVVNSVVPAGTSGEVARIQTVHIAPHRSANRPISPKAMRMCWFVGNSSGPAVPNHLNNLLSIEENYENDGNLCGSPPTASSMQV